MNKTQLGDISEQKFILYCLENNIPICKPIGNNLPYDFIIDFNNKLLKIQVKTAYKSKYKDTWTFNTRSCSKNYNEIIEDDYIGKIDYFAVVIPEGNLPFSFVPIDKASKGSMNIYYGNSPKANQNSFKLFKMI